MTTWIHQSSVPEHTAESGAFIYIVLNEEVFVLFICVFHIPVKYMVIMDNKHYYK